MGFLSFMISGLMITLGILIQALFPEQQIGVLIRNYAGIPVYLLSELVQNLMKNMGNNRVAARILLKYSNDIDNSIKENVFDISDISSIEEFLDYKFIYSQTEYEINF